MAWLIKWWMPVIGWIKHDVRDRCYLIERPGRWFVGARRLRTNFRSTKIGSKKVDGNPGKNVGCPGGFPARRLSLRSAYRRGTQNPVIPTDFRRINDPWMWQKRNYVEKLQKKCCVALEIS